MIWSGTRACWWPSKRSSASRADCARETCRLVLCGLTSTPREPLLKEPLREPTDDVKEGSDDSLDSDTGVVCCTPCGVVDSVVACGVVACGAAIASAAACSVSVSEHIDGTGDTATAAPAEAFDGSVTSAVTSDEGGCRNSSWGADDCCRRCGFAVAAAALVAVLLTRLRNADGNGFTDSLPLRA
jgi:hypothetical protein